MLANSKNIWKKIPSGEAATHTLGQDIHCLHETGFLSILTGAST
jgi:hypothetical protein